MEVLVKILGLISTFAIPFIFIFILGYAFFVKKVKVYEVFTEGAKDGFKTCIKIIPYLVAMLVAIGMFKASGAMDFMTKVLRPLTNLIHMPSEVLPLGIMRPLSGGGARGILIDLLNTYGPDSLIGRMASTMQGSTETTFYVLAVYFGSVAIKKTRHALAAGLVADFVGLMASIFIVNLVFG